MRTQCVALVLGLGTVVVLGGCGANPKGQPAAPKESTAGAPRCAADQVACGGRPEPSRDTTPDIALEVTGIEPRTGSVDGGTYVRITGNGFLAGGARKAKVFFGVRQGTVVRFASDSELIVEAPGGKPGEVVDVLVIFQPGGELAMKNAFSYVE